MIVVVASFHVPCFSYAPEHTRNHISETPADFCLVHNACIMHLLKLCSPACLNFYFAPITCCLAHTTMHS